MAESFRIFTSKVIPIDAENVDTDQIVPARYLKVTDKAGLADALFRDWRFEEDGSLKDPPFILDTPGMPGRAILIVGDNFGSGSSREHAPWALGEYGFRVIIAPSFADIFANNCFKNGMLPITLPEDQVRKMMRHAQEEIGYKLTIDLERQTIEDTNGLSIPFGVSEFQRYCLLEGLDDIGLTLRHEDAIDAYEATHTSRW